MCNPIRFRRHPSHEFAGLVSRTRSGNRNGGPKLPPVAPTILRQTGYYFRLGIANGMAGRMAPSLIQIPP
jgi:hypothetical protein